MKSRTTLGRLTYEDLEASAAWVATGETEEQDQVLVPVVLRNGRVPRTAGEVWCLSVSRFADATEHLACTMCRGDNEDGPLAWTIWNGERDVSLLLPPAPPFVLAEDGPEPFARAFNKKISEVFPLEIRALPEFEIEPTRRIVRLGAQGVLV